MKSAILALILALRAVESTNGLTSANELQIQPICIQDVNRIYGTSYNMSDVYNRRRSEEIAVLYLTYWGSKASANPTSEIYARIWNGGPNGWKNPKTVKYWKRVKKQLDKNSLSKPRK